MRHPNLLTPSSLCHQRAPILVHHCYSRTQKCFLSLCSSAGHLKRTNLLSNHWRHLWRQQQQLPSIRLVHSKPLKNEPRVLQRAILSSMIAAIESLQLLSLHWIRVCPCPLTFVVVIGGRIASSLELSLAPLQDPFFPHFWHRKLLI